MARRSQPECSLINIAVNGEQKAPSRRIPPFFFSFFLAFHISPRKNTRRSKAARSPTSIILPIYFFCRSRVWSCELESLLRSPSAFSLRLLRAILKDLDCQRRLFSKPGSDSTAGSNEKEKDSQTSIMSAARRRVTHLFQPLLFQTDDIQVKICPQPVALVK